MEEKLQKNQLPSTLLEMSYRDFDAVLRELSARREEIAGGRMDCLGNVEILIRLYPADTPTIEITKHIDAIPDLIV